MRLFRAAFATAVLSGAFSFAPVRLQPSRRYNHPFGARDGERTKLSLSPGDMVASVPGLLLYPSVFAVCFRIGAALAVIGQPRLPPSPQGSPPVGSKVLRLPELGSRVRVFYPISDEAAEAFVAGSHRDGYCTDGRATSDGMAGLVGFRQLGLSFLLAHLAEAPSGCRSGSGDGFAACERGAPLLVYSHGYGGNMDMATYFLRAVAQRGIVVAAVEHTDGTASSTVLADGTRLDFDASRLSLRDGLDLRARELTEATSLLPTLLPETSGVFLGGHSYGAPSALLAAQRQREPRIAGLILHDPALSMGRGRLELPPRIPTVSYVSDEYHQAGVACGDGTYHVKGAFHGNFVDAPLWAPLWVMRTLSVVIPACGPADPRSVHAELADSAREFCVGGNPNAATVAGDPGLLERVG